MPTPDSTARFPHQLGRRQLIALDGVAALAYIAFLLPLVVAEESGAGRVPLWVRCTLVAAAGVPLAARRVRPRPVFALVLTATLLQVLLGLAMDPFVAAAYALYPLALTTTSQRLIPTPAVAMACATVVLFGMVAGSPQGWQHGVGFLVVGAAVLGAVWTTAFAVRGRRTLARVEAARREEQAVHRERLRIARELHDVVTHTMGLITVKASVANHVLAARPEEAHDALKVIETVSREAMTEMRGILRVLRVPPTDDPNGESNGESSDDPSGDTSGERGGQRGSGRGGERVGERVGERNDERNDEAVDLAPAPGLSDVPALVRRAEHAGVRVELTMSPRCQVPDGVGLAGYRIVQEALTNVMTHAAPTSCTVRIEATASDLRMEIHDEGPPTRGRARPRPRPGGGHGITGMRERAKLYGGTLTAAPHRAGGFQVTAHLPFPPKPSETL
ncbi:histidine kinase [Streptomyces sp. NPDC001868]|uniref:sensor histidine kinase n=1 Tax=Streptomyces sp. NPDC001868 TaxID=3154401 RepID=UPI00331CE1E7